MPFLKAEDLPDSSFSTEEIDFSDCLGVWRNTLQSTNCITGFTLSEEQNNYTFHPVMKNAPSDWERKKITPILGDIHSNKAVAFHLHYDLDFMECLLAANYNAGLFIIATYTIYRDSTERKSKFTREFFHKDK